MNSATLTSVSRPHGPSNTFQRSTHHLTCALGVLLSALRSVSSYFSTRHLSLINEIVNIRLGVYHISYGNILNNNNNNHEKQLYTTHDRITQTYTHTHTHSHLYTDRHPLTSTPTHRQRHACTQFTCTCLQVKKCATRKWSRI